MQDVTSSERGWFSRLRGFCALLAAVTLLVGTVGLATRSPDLRPWLAALFGINAGVGGVSTASLRVVAAVDLLVLAFAGFAFMGFWPGPAKPHKLWTGLAILLPFAGIAVLLATGLAGRSGLMGGGLVLSILLLGDRDTRSMGCLGVVANLLLLAGDFATGDSRSVAIAGLVGMGYALLIAWLLWIAAGLLTWKSDGHT